MEKKELAKWDPASEIKKKKKSSTKGDNNTTQNTCRVKKSNYNSKTLREQKSRRKSPKSEQIKRVVKYALCNNTSSKTKRIITFHKTKL
jgi:hypothetical protein